MYLMYIDESGKAEHSDPEPKLLKNESRSKGYGLKTSEPIVNHRRT